MELLLLMIAVLFYLIIGYTALFLGIVTSIISFSRLRHRFVIYWVLFVIEHALIVTFFGYLQWVFYLIGWSIGQLYLPSYFDGSELTGLRSSRWFRRLRLWRVLHWWTDFKHLSPDIIHGPSLIAVHPHGFLPVSVALGFVLVGQGDHPIIDDKTGKDPLIAVTRIVFWIPVIRELCLWGGCIVADKESMIGVLLHGRRSLIVVPGGLREGTSLNHDKLRLEFCHWGFLDIARKAGVTILPIFAQGENRVWIVMPGWSRIQRLASHIALYPFPTIFIPFLFPHELRLRCGGTSSSRILLSDNLGSSNLDTRQNFTDIMKGLVCEYEHPDDIDL